MTAGIFETSDTKDRCKPSQINHVFKVFYGETMPNTYGKWLVFKHFDKLDATWEKICAAIDTGELDGCVGAKCSTMKYNPTRTGPGPITSGMISVRTNQDNMDPIGLKLVRLVEQDIQYKLFKATLSNKFTHLGSGKVIEKTIFWNDGSPSFTLVGKRFSVTSHDREDTWHLNVVTAPEPYGSKSYDGRWILQVENMKTTKLWHSLKSTIELEDNNFRVIKMVCPPKHRRTSPTEVPLFHLYTTSQDRESVGKKLIRYVEKDIDYEYRDRYKGRETLFWNDGEPAFEKVSRKGITKNWRTGKEL